jgi:catechol 2,3-dioxygenase-like lactoylglutathione lyase family enzyme
MRVRPIHFVEDLDAAVRFYRALGLELDAQSRSGQFIELVAAGGELALHDAGTAADGESRHGFAVNFLADEPLEDVERRLVAAGFPPERTIVDESWGRSLFVRAPDGTEIQIDEPDRELYT